MPKFIELSHVIQDGMITYEGLPGPKISDHLSREASRQHYAEGTTFQIGKINMVANTGAYSPAWRRDSDCRAPVQPRCSVGQRV